MIPGVGERVKNPPSSLAEWEVINRYSNRIRELKISDELSMSFLKITSPQQLSLPNLRQLKWDSTAVCRGWWDIMCIWPLLSPSLLVFDARTKMEKNRSLLSFFLNYHLLCPNLKSVKLDFSQAYGVWDDLDSLILAISKAIVDHKKLEWCLEISPPVREGFLEELLMSPTLKVISLVYPGCFPVFFISKVSISPTDTPLRNVRNLRLAIRQLSVFTSLLRPHDQSFRTICLEVDSSPSHTAAEEFSTALATHQRQDSLESITIDHPDRIVEEIGYPVTFDALRPLVHLGRLRELKILLPDGVSLDDTELAIMVGGWPLLEVLMLDSINPRFQPTTKYPTFAGLLTLLSSCPKLQALQLPLDARQVPENDCSEPCNTAISSLDLWGSPISDAGRVSRFLRARLPSVSSVPVVEWDDSEWGDMWKQVDADIRGYR